MITREERQQRASAKSSLLHSSDGVCALIIQDYCCQKHVYEFDPLRTKNKRNRVFTNLQMFANFLCLRCSRSAFRLAIQMLYSQTSLDLFGFIIYALICPVGA